MIENIKDIEIDISTSNSFNGIKVNEEYLSSEEAIRLAEKLATASSELLSSALATVTAIVD